MFLASKISKKLWKCFQVSRPQRREQRTHKGKFLQLPSSKASWFYIFKHLLWIIETGSAGNLQWGEEYFQMASKTWELMPSVWGWSGLGSEFGLQDSSPECPLCENVASPACIPLPLRFKGTVCTSAEPRVKLGGPVILHQNELAGRQPWGVYSMPSLLTPKNAAPCPDQVSSKTWRLSMKDFCKWNTSGLFLLFFFLILHLI